jgi:ubiquitin-protein ligase
MSTDATAASNPRLARLEWEQERLLALNQQCDYVHVKPHPLADGAPAERYTVHYLCRSIVGLEPDESPVFSEGPHTVQIYCDSSFPADVPKLDWLTPIWHPNIKHTEPRVVCVNKAEWLAGMGLDYLCWQMFDMVQYKNYHAKETWPYPQDHEVAKWVREYAEPHNIVNKARGVSTDDRPFFKQKIAQRVKFQSYSGVSISTPSRVRFVTGAGETPPPSSLPPQPAVTRVKFVASSSR